jgi:hypothetical protein
MRNQPQRSRDSRDRTCMYAKLLFCAVYMEVKSQNRAELLFMSPLDRVAKASFSLYGGGLDFFYFSLTLPDRVLVTASFNEQ